VLLREDPRVQAVYLAWLAHRKRSAVEVTLPPPTVADG
jgi:hypothetical protein